MAEKWNPPVELSEREERVMKRVKKRPLFRFFREHRHVLFDEQTQKELLKAYGPPRGKAALPPAQMALAMLMQAAFGVPDHELPELTACDSRWQMVLDCLGVDEPIMSQGSVFNFRMRAIHHGFDRLLIDRTVQLAKETKGYSAAKLRAALDSSPLVGAGRVEDTFNLIARAATHVVRAAAERLGKPVSEVAEMAGIPLVEASSIKAALDLNWSDKAERTQGLRTLLGQVDSLRAWLAAELGEACKQPPLEARLATLKQVCEQDIEPDPDDGGPRIKRGVEPDRRISISDADMRHGRKSKSKRFDGYKQHVLIDMDIPGLIRAGVVTPANQPEAEATAPLVVDAEAQGDELGELHVDRAYVGNEPVTQRPSLRLVAKPHPVRNGDLFSKEEFEMDFERMTLTCPGNVTVPMSYGQTVKFPTDRCAACSLRPRCTRAAKNGRQVRIHDQEPLQAHLRSVSQTQEGRAEYRQRVAVEHALARIAQLKGRRARYRGKERNDFDLRRHIVVSNCYVLDRMWRQAA